MRLVRIKALTNALVARHGANALRRLRMLERRDVHVLIWIIGCLMRLPDAIVFYNAVIASAMCGLAVVHVMKRAPLVRVRR